LNSHKCDTDLECGFQTLNSREETFTILYSYLGYASL
jgi:hypothetical protein